MNKKCLYKVFDTNYLNGICCSSNITAEPCLHYGELPNSYSECYTLSNEQELLLAFNSRKFSGIYLAEHFFTGKRTYDKLTDWILEYVPDNDVWARKMPWKTFQQITWFREYKEMPINAYTFKQLMEKLSADEFIDFCNDYAVMIKGVNLNDK